MRMHYEVSFRKQVLRVLEEEGLSIRSVAKRFGISPNTVYLWKKRISRKPRKVKAYKIDMDKLKEDIVSHPDAYNYERAKRLGVSISCIYYALKRLGVSYKKNPEAPEGMRQKTAHLPVGSGTV